jgi:hypothetical protein
MGRAPFSQSIRGGADTHVPCSAAINTPSMIDAGASISKRLLSAASGATATQTGSLQSAQQQSLQRQPTADTALSSLRLVSP